MQNLTIINTKMSDKYVFICRTSSQTELQSAEHTSMCEMWATGNCWSSISMKGQRKRNSKKTLEERDKSVPAKKRQRVASGSCNLSRKPAIGKENCMPKSEPLLCPLCYEEVNFSLFELHFNKCKSDEQFPF